MADNQEKTETSKTIVLTGHGGLDKLKIQQKERPKPGKGQVLVNVKAAGINFAELMARQGMYPNAPKPPCVLGYEASGVVTQLGEETNSVKVGDRVIVINNFGTWCEFIAVNEENLFPMPDGMSHEEGAAIPVNYLTAYMMLHDFGNLRKGKSVLVHMAAGGVGIAATQLCSAVGDVTVFGTASSPKHDVIKEAGVTHPIDYRTQDYTTEIRKISPQGVDIVLDPLSGEDSVKGYELLKPMGKIIHFGAANMVTGTSRNLMQVMKTWWGTKNINPLKLMSHNKAVCGFHLGHLTEHTELIRDNMIALLEMYKKGEIKPRIDTTWAVEDIDLAMGRMHDRQNIGKVVLSFEKAPSERATPEQPEKGKKKDVKTEPEKKEEKVTEKKPEEKIEEKSEEKKEEE